MIIIDKSQEIETFLKSREEMGLATIRLNAETFERANGLDGDLLVLHADVLDGAEPLFKKKLASQRMVAIFGKLPSQAFPQNCVLEFNSDSEEQKICSQLVNLENSLKEFMSIKSQLLTINRELEETLGTVETELMRVKKVREEKRPNRFQNIKGVSALSKYAAGDSVGGEFFDIFKAQGKIFLMMSETSSYLASSSILQIFSDFKNEQDLSSEAQINLLKEIKTEAAEINSNKKKKPLKISLLTGILDLNTYEVKGHVFGDFKLRSSRQDKSYGGNRLDFLNCELEEGEYTRALERGERLLLLSPGFSKNWEETSPQVMIETLMNNKKIKLLDILDEIFFQLKKDAKGGFLAHDASAIMLEVQKNVMLQV